MLSVGDFDERIFLGEDAHTEIGTPAKTPPPPGGDFMHSMQHHIDQVSLYPTPKVTDVYEVGRGFC